MYRLLFDTNFLLDFIDPDRPDSDDAVSLFKETVSGRYDGRVAASSLKDMYYVLSKFRGESEARDWVRAFMRVLTVEEIDAEVCAIALDSDEPDYEDGCIRAIAERSQVDFIITRDEDAFARSWVKTYSAKRFNELFGVGA